MAGSTHPGHGAFASYLATIEGFREEDPATCIAHIESGRDVLVHGWPGWINRHVGKSSGCINVLWHSGWTVTDLLNEQAALATAIEAGAQGKIRLLWLHPSTPPQCAERLPFAWDSTSIKLLAGERAASTHKGLSPLRP